MIAPSIPRHALSLLFLAMAAHTARAQETPGASLAIAGGPSLALGSDGAIGGVHLQLFAESGSGRSIRLRADALVVASFEGVAQPSCLSGPCNSYTTPYPGLLYSSSLSLVVPMGAPDHPFYGLAGVGVYHGGGYKSTSEKYGSTGGASVGVGLSSMKIIGHDIGLELRYHHLFGGLGQLHGFFMPSIKHRF